jgi:hypothetical protein
MNGLIERFKSRLSARPARRRPHRDRRWIDPLAHPDLRNMTLVQLADLPFDRSADMECPDGPDACRHGP